MAYVPQFFVVVFSRTKAKKIRAEAAIKAFSERHAKSLASHFAGEEQGAIALSRRGDNINVVGQFGGAVANNSYVWAFRRALGPLAPANPLTRTRSAIRTERPLNMHSRRRRLL
jgi:hypothetical protein